jgi:hypothetical protein
MSGCSELALCRDVNGWVREVRLAGLPDNHDPSESIDAMDSDSAVLTALPSIDGASMDLCRWTGRTSSLGDFATPTAGLRSVIVGLE